jgi:hypothetical protein
MKEIKLTPVKIKLMDIGSIVDAENEFCDKIWYNRCHLRTKEELKNGELKLVKKWKPEYSTQNFISKDIWEGAKKAAKKVEKKYGKKNLGPYSDFEWGMLNGKLSAIRWVLGDDWDQLDT